MEENQSGHINLVIRLSVVCKAMRLFEVTKKEKKNLKKGRSPRSELCGLQLYRVEKKNPFEQGKKEMPLRGKMTSALSSL